MNITDDITLCKESLERFGVEIRRDGGDSAGGLARVRGECILFIPDRRVPEQILAVCLDAIKQCAAGYAGTSQIQYPPRLRQLLGEEEWDE